MKEKLWTQFKKNGYVNKNEEGRRTKIEDIKKKEKRKKKEKNWYGITSIGQHIERVKAILKREGINIYRIGGEKLEWKVNKK